VEDFRPLNRRGKIAYNKMEFELAPVMLRSAGPRLPTLIMVETKESIVVQLQDAVILERSLWETAVEIHHDHGQLHVAMSADSLPYLRGVWITLLDTLQSPRLAILDALGASFQTVYPMSANASTSLLANARRHADGGGSSLAERLGVVPSEPTAVFSKDRFFGESMSRGGVGNSAAAAIDQNRLEKLADQLVMGRVSYFGQFIQLQVDFDSIHYYLVPSLC
jgi:hypothetical protein